MSSLKKSTSLLFTVGCCIGVLGCGGGSRDTMRDVAAASNSARAAQVGTLALVPPSLTSLRAVVAHVAGKPITLAEIRHMMTIANAPAPLPDPPQFAACTARTKAEATSTGQTPLPPAQLKSACQKHYEELLETALSTAIHREWVSGEAAEEHIAVSPGEVQQEFDKSKRESFKTDAEFEAYRRGTRETIADMKNELGQTKLTDKILNGIKAREHPVDSAQVARYYDSHRQQFAIPQGRRVRILRTATEGAVLKLKRQLQSGTSFANAAKGLSSIAQPVGAENGEIADLKPGVIEEKKLNDAIFNAQLNRLYGPLELTATHKTIAAETNTGFFVFEVIGLVPGGQRSLAQVKRTIAQELAKAQESQTFTSFVAGFRRKWLARTDCQPGYVVRNCKQLKQSKAQEEIELHAL